jgi:Xaa-Pro aminopeptidase
MRYKKISSELFINNRLQFANNMDNNSVAIFNSNDLMPKNADQNLPFFQNSDLFYLSGVDQEESLLMIVKNGTSISSHLFLRETNDLIKVWEGEKLDKNNACSISGIKNVYWDKEFEKVLNTYVSECGVIYLNSNEHPRAEIIVESRDVRFEKWIKKKIPKQNI